MKETKNILNLIHKVCNFFALKQQNPFQLLDSKVTGQKLIQNFLFLVYFARRQSCKVVCQTKVRLSHLVSFLRIVVHTNLQQYVIRQVTNKEPKSDDLLSKFDWHNLSPIFLTIMLLHNLKVFQKPIKHHLVAIQWQS